VLKMQAKGQVLSTINGRKALWWRQGALPVVAPQWCQNWCQYDPHVHLTPSSTGRQAAAAVSHILCKVPG
jgi:hypothetical protein